MPHCGGLFGFFHCWLIEGAKLCLLGHPETRAQFPWPKVEAGTTQECPAGLSLQAFLCSWNLLPWNLREGSDLSSFCSQGASQGPEYHPRLGFFQLHRQTYMGSLL